MRLLLGTNMRDKIVQDTKIDKIPRKVPFA